MIWYETPFNNLQGKMISHGTIDEKTDLTLIGGSEDCHEIAQYEHGLSSFVTVSELAGIFPLLVPLSSKAGYPVNQKEIR